MVHISSASQATSSPTRVMPLNLKMPALARSSVDSAWAGSAANDVAALEHEHVPAGAGEIPSGNQAVMSRSDHDYIVSSRLPHGAFPLYSSSAETSNAAASSSRYACSFSLMRSPPIPRNPPVVVAAQTAAAVSNNQSL